MTITIRKAFILSTLIFTTALFAADPKLKDYPEAQELEQKAEKGDGYAMRRLGLYYSGVIGDEKKAVYWFTKECGKLTAKCADSIADLYMTGDEYENDDKLIFWLKKAHELGAKTAAHSLAELYEWRHRDLEESYAYFEQSDDKNASAELARLKKEADENMAYAREWYQKAYERGDMQVIYKLIELNDYDANKRLELYMNGYKDKVGDSAYFIANTYEELKDYPNAIKWYEIDYKELNYSTGTPYSLANIYKELKDYPNAIKWYKIAIDNNNPFAQRELQELEQELANQESNSTISNDLNLSK
jgi:TPR repeat protein